MKAQQHKLRTTNAGFSLVEMLIVIGVIGVMAAIAIPIIGNISGTAKNTKNKRNAQNAASVWAAAVAAGYNVVETDAAGALDKLQTGIGAAENSLGVIFKCDLTDAEELAALPHLGFSDTLLTYTP